MAGKRISFGLVWMVCGVIIIILSLGADLFGIGSSTGIGWKQLVGAAVGLVVLIVGFLLRRVK
jgi:hypothetical protein